MTVREARAFSLCRTVIGFLMTAIVVVIGCLGVALPAQTPGSTEDVAKRKAADLALFERKAGLAKELGATHMIVTEGLPLATWEMDPNDPRSEEHTSELQSLRHLV